MKTRTEARFRTAPPCMSVYLPASCRRPRRSGGFTLIELIVVMVILVLLAGTVTVGVMKYVGSSRTKRARLDIAQFETALNLYKTDNGDFPTSDQGLSALVAKPSGSDEETKNWDGPYLKSKSLTKDPWGRDYNYRFPGEHNQEGFDLWTLGRDNKDGGSGEDSDTDNWSEDEGK